MKKILISVTIYSVFLFGCSNSSDSANTTSEVISDTSAMIEAPPITDVPVQVQSTDSSTLVSSPVSAAAVPVQPVASNEKGLNPAHGEPGHRCDIAVGAPLNSPPAAPSPAAAAPAPGTMVTTPAATAAPAPAVTPAPVTTAPGTNPPHGQPGHDCKIAVGAPLPK